MLFDASDPEGAEENGGPLPGRAGVEVVDSPAEAGLAAAEDIEQLVGGGVAGIGSDEGAQRADPPAVRSDGVELVEDKAKPPTHRQ
jgi:hypothetical protein